MKRILLNSAVLLALCSTSFSVAQRAPSGAARSKAQVIDSKTAIALVGATVIDGTGARPRTKETIVIAKGRIVYVGNAAGIRFGPQTLIMDLAGRWIIPGFIDAHTHLPGADGAAFFLAQLVAFGTTTMRAAANPRVELRDLIASEKVLGPRLLVAGALIDGKDSATGSAARVSTANEAINAVRKQAEEKVDFIKLYVGLPPDVACAAIKEAHLHGLRVIGHLGRTTWLEAADMGIDSLAHSWYAGLAHSIVPVLHRAEFGDFYIPNARFNPALFRRWREVVDLNGPEIAQLISRLISHHIEVTPNLVLGEAVTWGDDPAALERLEPEFAPPEIASAWRRGRHPYSSNWPAEAMAEAKNDFPLMIRLIQLFYERGVLLTAGTDYMNPWMTPGVAFHRELQLLTSSGIPPLEVLKIATRNGAEALGIASETGTIETGKRADLVVLTADPLAAISNTRKIEHIFLNGRSFTPVQLIPIRPNAAR
jgi:imidazolonepropionase-like amidohydrolase